MELRTSRAQAVTVADAMTRRPVCIDVSDSAQDAARRMAEQGVGALPVCRGNRLVGMLTDRDMVLRVLAQAGDPRLVTVGDCLQGDVASVGSAERLSTAAERMHDHGVRRLAVVDDGRLVGIVTQADIARHDADAAGSLERALGRHGADVRSAAWLFDQAYGRRSA